jgi:hypothetical protein
MDLERRALLKNSLAGIAAIGVVGLSAADSESEEKAASITAEPKNTHLKINDMPVEVQQAIAALKVEKCMNRYETLLSSGYLDAALNEFALSKSDVQADVGWGLYYGPEYIKKLFIDVHGMLQGDVNKGTLLKGATYLVANTTGIIEVAEDLQTAKGLWLCPTLSTPGNEKDGFSGRTGYAHRAGDFYCENGQWKLWHYMVYGLASAPVGKSWTDPEVVEKNQVDRFAWIPEHLKPNGPRAPGIGAMGGWRPDRKVFSMKVPVPYKTFSETFSYAYK